MIGIIGFRNNYSATVWVTVMYYDPDSCSGEGSNWATAGWWEIQPGAMVWAMATTNQYAAYYADAGDSATWSGPYGPCYVYLDAFASCAAIGSNNPVQGKDVGMRLIDLGNLTDSIFPAFHTVNLNP